MEIFVVTTFQLTNTCWHALGDLFQADCAIRVLILMLGETGRRGRVDIRLAVALLILIEIRRLILIEGLRVNGEDWRRWRREPGPSMRRGEAAG